MKKENNKRFVDAVKWLKDYYGIAYRKIYDELDMGRGRWDSIKKGLSNVNDWDVDRLQKMYPETEKFFKKDYIFEEKTQAYKVKPISEDSLYLKKYIESLEAQIELLKQQLTKKEAEEQYQKLLIEVKELLKHKNHPD